METKNRIFKKNPCGIVTVRLGSNLKNKAHVISKELGMPITKFIGSCVLTVLERDFKIPKAEMLEYKEKFNARKCRLRTF